MTWWYTGDTYAVSEALEALNDMARSAILQQNCRNQLIVGTNKKALCKSLLTFWNLKFGLSTLESDENFWASKMTHKLEFAELVKQSTLRHFLAANCFVNLIFNTKLTQNHLESFLTNTFPCQKSWPYLYSKRVSQGLRGGPWGLEGFWFGGFGLQSFTKDSNCLTKSPINSWNQKQILTFQGTNRSDLGKSKIFLKYTLGGGYVSFQDTYFFCWRTEVWGNPPPCWA